MVSSFMSYLDFENSRRPLRLTCIIFVVVVVVVDAVMLLRSLKQPDTLR